MIRFIEVFNISKNVLNLMITWLYPLAMLLSLNASHSWEKRLFAASVLLSTPFRISYSNQMHSLSESVVLPAENKVKFIQK